MLIDEMRVLAGQLFSWLLGSYLDTVFPLLPRRCSTCWALGPGESVDSIKWVSKFLV